MRVEDWTVLHPTVAGRKVSVLPAVQAPALFMTGSAHPEWSPEQMRAAATLLPQGSTRVLDGAAYLVPLENPDEFSRCVKEFWGAALR